MLKATIVRVLAFAALFAYFLPFVFGAAGFGSSFVFTGGVFAALGLGVAYVVAMFALLGLFYLVLTPLRVTLQQRKDMWPATTAVIYLVSALCLLGANFVPWLGLSVAGWVPALIGGATAVGVMWATLPLASSE